MSMYNYNHGCMACTCKPAGDVEVQAWKIPFGPVFTDADRVEDVRKGGYQVIELVDRAHVTRLQGLHQGELAGAQEMLKIAYAERDALKAEVERLKTASLGVWHDLGQAQSELTKARELLKMFYKEPSMCAFMSSVIGQFLTLQPAPVAKGEGDE